MIELVLVTGFLGTGKTTLLTQLLDAYRDEPIGLIVNEFGEVGIDGVLVERDGIRMKELSNGSIFCACIKDKFITSLVALSKEPIRYLFIEASGLADPANFPQILDSIAKLTEGRYHYKGSVCVVDAETFLDYLELLPALRQQVIYSNSVIVNKIDLAEPDRVAEIADRIDGENPGARVLFTRYCRLDYRELVESLAPVERPGEETSNTVESRPKTFVLHGGREPLPLPELKDFLSSIAGEAYRIKGFARTTEGDLYISGVGRRFEYTPWNGPVAETRIVVISAVGIRMMSRITAGLAGSLKPYLHL